MASISRLPSGKYRVIWRDHQRKQRTSAAVKSRIEAEALRRQVEGDLRRQASTAAVAQAGQLMDLQAVVLRYCESGKASGRLKAGRAWEVETTLDRLIEETGWETTAACTADEIDRWRVAAQQKGQGDNPIRYLLAVLRWAQGAPLRQPVDPGCFMLPRMRGSPRPPPELLREDQVAEIVRRARSIAGDAGAAILVHLATYGCRPVEACRLVVADIDPVQGTLTHPRTKNDDPVTHPLMAEHLEAYRLMIDGRAPTDALFPSPDGDPWWLGKRGSAAELTGWYRDRLTKDLPTRQRGIYCLKDYAISRMEAAGIDDRTKALFTGHRSLSSFQRYKATNHDRAHAALQRLRVAAPPPVLRHVTPCDTDLEITTT